MGTYTLDLDDGSQVTVEAPKDTPLRELLTLATQQRLEGNKSGLLDRQQARQAVLESRASAEIVGGRGGKTAIGRGIGRGIDSLQQNLGSATEGIGSVLGLEGLEKFGSEVALSNEAELQRAERFATRLGDVDGVGRGLSAAGELVGESAPQMAQVAAGAAAGAAYGGAGGAAFFGIGAAPGAAIGAVVGGALAAIPLFFGGNRERQISAAGGDRTGVNEGVAALTAIPQALADSIFTMLGAKYVLGPLAKAAPAAQGLLTRSVKGAGVGAATEVPTEIGQAVLERAQAGLSLTSAEAIREYGEAGLAAGLLGGGLGGIGGAARRTATPEAEPEAGALPAVGEQLEMDLEGGSLKRDRTRGAGLRTNYEGEQGEFDLRGGEGTAPERADARQAEFDLLDPVTPDAVTREGEARAAAQEADTEPNLADRMEQLLLEDPNKRPIEIDSKGVATTDAMTPSERRVEQRGLGMAIVEKARNEIRSTGQVSSTTMQQLRTAGVPAKSISKVLEETKYDPANAVSGPTRFGGAVTQNADMASEAPAPTTVQDKERLAKAVANQKSGLGALAGRQEADIEAELALEQTQETSARLRKAKAAQLDAETEALGTITEPEVDLAAQLRAESTAETAEGKLDTDRAKQSKATRTKILQDTVANAGDKRQPAALQKAFESALTAAGIGKATATPAEVASIAKASDVIRAKTPEGITPLVEPVVSTRVEALKDPRQKAMEAEVAPKPVEPTQQSLPTLGRKRDLGTPPQRPGQDTLTAAEPTVEPKIVDAALFDKLGVPPSAPIRKRVMGKDFNDTDVRQQFSTLAGNKNTSATVKTNINRELQATPEAQLDLPLTKRKTEAKEKTNVKTAKTKSKPSRDSVPTPKSDVGSKPKTTVPSAAVAAKGAKKPAAPRTSGVGSTVVESGSATGTTGTKSDTLTKSKPVKKEGPTDAQVSTATAIGTFLKSKQREKDAATLYSEVASVNDVSTAQARELVTRALLANKKLKLPTEVALDLPVDESVTTAAKSGDLKSTLEALAATTTDTQVAALAKRLAANVGSTTVEVRKNLKADDGGLVSGFFDPETNTITLDEKTGTSQHTILHEMLHAVTSATIANKAHPLTKKLTKIYEGSKEQLAGEYGITSLDEFVAEAMANPDFQTQLKTTTVNGRNPWQQMTRAIANFVRTLLGRPTVSETSTFDAVDNLVQELISPTYDGRAATKIYMKIENPAGAAEVVNDIGTAPNAIDVTTKKGMYDYLQEGRGFMGSKIPLQAKKVWLNLQPVNILSTLSESRIPGAAGLNTIINNMSAALRGRNESLDPIVNDLRAFRKKEPKLYTILQSMVPNASKERIDPREANFEKAYGRDKSDGERYEPVRAREVHKKLRKDYEAMGPEGQKLYKIVTNNFEKSLNDVMGAIEANLAATVGDVAARKKAKDKLAELLNRERGRIKPFAPLTRFGPHRLEYNALDPETNQPEMFVEYFKTIRQLEKAKVKVLEYNKSSLAKIPANDPRRAYIVDKDGGPVGMNSGKASEIRDFSKAPPTSFVYEVIQILNAQGADAATVERVVNLAIDSMPERSFMQSFQKRKDVRGFLGDVTPTGMAAEAYDLIDMVQTKGRDYNRQLVQMEYGAKLEIFQRDVLGLDAKRTDPITMLYRDRLDLIATFAKSPNIPRWSQSLTAAGYAWTMGWNLSSAAITTFDVLMSTAPRLMGKYGDKATFRAMGAAASILTKSPKTKMVAVMDENGNMTKRKVNTGMAGFSIGNYDYTDPNLDPKIKELEILAEVATENAQINQSLNQEELDMNNAKDLLEKFNSWTSFLFHHSERYNREVAMTANYLLEVDRMKAKKGSALTDLEKREAAAIAVKETEFTLGATASAGRPVYSQTPVGNVAMLFKRFAISKYHMMATMTNDAFQAGGDADTKENRRVAQRSLARFLISTGLFAGVAGMPLMGAVGQIYNLFVADDEDDFDAMLRKTVGEGLYGGAINAALGVDVASRIGMNSLLYRPPIIDKDQSAFYTLIEQFGGPVVGIGLSVERGFKDAAKGEYARAVKAIAPAAVRNVLKSGEQIATGEVRTRRGDAVVEDIGIAQILAQAGGFANADVNRQYDINKNERRKNTYLGKKRTSLLRQANLAAANGDREGYRQALRDIKEYNRGLPRAARTKNIILPKTIERSRKAFDTRTGKMIGGIEYTPMMRSSLEEYDQGIQLFD